MVLYVTALWFYALMASLVFGASLYESLVVHPAWSRQPPESFAGFVAVPISRMEIAAFWMPAAPLFALSSLVATAAAFSTGLHALPLMLSTVCAVTGVAWTLVYFRPAIVCFLEHGGGTMSVDRLRLQARRWILLNWIRVALVAVSWWGALAALATSR